MNAHSPVGETSQARADAAFLALLDDIEHAEWKARAQRMIADRWIDGWLPAEMAMRSLVCLGLIESSAEMGNGDD